LVRLFATNGWLAAVPPCLGFAGWLFGGMGSKPVLSSCILVHFIIIELLKIFTFLNRNQNGQVLSQVI
jgi:hypothetical protein